MLLRAGSSILLGMAFAVASLTSPVSALVNCGGPAESCCGPEETCDEGLVCADCNESLPGTGGGAALNCPACRACGGLDEPCCPDDQCDSAGLACVGGTCQDCGKTGLGCCDGDPECAEGFTCGPITCFDVLQGQGGGAGNCEALGTGGGAEVDFECFPCGGDLQRCCDRGVCNPGSQCGPTVPCESPGDSVGRGSGAGCEAPPPGTGSGGQVGPPLILCTPCGELGEPCCGELDPTCNQENLLCGGELCEACGAIDQQCCDNNTCPVEGLCVSGTCRPGAAPAMGGAGIASLVLLLTGIGAFGMRRLQGF